MAFSSYDYQIERLTPEHEDDFNRVRGGGPGQCSEYIIGCSGYTSKKPCREHVKWHCSYAYITGRQGRTTHADRYYCDTHARKFAASHGITMPEEPMTIDEQLRRPCGICGKSRNAHLGKVFGCPAGYGTSWNPDGKRDERVWPYPIVKEASP